MLLIGLGKMIKKVTSSLNLLTSRILGFTIVTTSGSGYYGATTVRSLKPAVMLYGSWFQKLSGVTVSSGKPKYVSDESSKIGKFAIGDEYIISMSSGVFSYSADGETWVDQFYFVEDEGGFVDFKDGYYVATNGSGIWIGTDPTSASFSSYNPGNRQSTHLYAQAKFYNNEILIDGPQGTVVKYNKSNNQTIAVEISPAMYWVSIKKAGLQNYLATSYDTLPFKSESGFMSWSPLSMPSGLNLNSGSSHVLEAGTDDFYFYFSQNDYNSQHGRRRAWITYDGGDTWAEEYFGYYVPIGVYDYSQPTFYFASAAKMQESDNSIQLTVYANNGSGGQAINLTPNGILNSVPISDNMQDISRPIPGTKVIYRTFNTFNVEGQFVSIAKRFDFDTMVETDLVLPKTGYSLGPVFFDQQTQQYIYVLYSLENYLDADLYISADPMLTNGNFISKVSDEQIIGLFPTLATYDEVQSSIGNQTDGTAEVLAPVDVYVVPSGKTAYIDQVTIRNNSSNTITYDLDVLDPGAELTDENLIRNDQEILAGATAIVTTPAFENLTAGQRIVVFPSAVDVVEVKVYGTETVAPNGLTLDFSGMSTGWARVFNDDSQPGDTPLSFRFMMTAADAIIAVETPNISGIDSWAGVTFTINNPTPYMGGSVPAVLSETFTLASGSVVSDMMGNFVTLRTTNTTSIGSDFDFNGTATVTFP